VEALDLCSALAAYEAIDRLVHPCRVGERPRQPPPGRTAAILAVRRQFGARLPDAVDAALVNQVGTAES
jgi:hypothetical protein